MALQTTQPPSHTIEKNWPKRILIGIGITIAVLFLGLLIYAGIKGGGTIYENDGQNNEGNGNQGIAVGEPNPNGYDCTKDVYNCENFTTQSEAQVAFDSCINDDKGDVWGLDADGDGRVCEGLG